MNTAAERVAHLRLLGRLDDAEEQARSALAAEPTHPDVLCELSAVLLAKKRFDEALAAADAATGAAPEHERPHRLRGLALSAMGRHPEAVEAGYLAVSIEPEHPTVATAYAEILQRAGRLGDALNVARLVVTMAPHTADSHFLIADITSDMGDMVTARAAYTEALRLDPQHALAQHDLAVLDLRARRPGRALQGLMQAGALAPGQSTLLPNVAAVLWRLSWRLRICIWIATIVIMTASGRSAGQHTTVAQLLAIAALVVGGVLMWHSSRDLPPQTRPVLMAALRSDVPLAITYGALALCVLALVATAVTGFALFGAFIILVLVALALLAVVVGLFRRGRR
ncbi:tetratricopeptide repeat protein [Pseudonocardia sp. TRM90224]|uniref:tetratricopeptide repeat protein n=1 Tax=Pseudonocardia sp. TRM90224 TaxID=2812678 RepID=UPI001E367959|nr:tetratricopeptide repeat protein [Pseudonocardia sp. TRM90224]